MRNKAIAQVLRQVAMMHYENKISSYRRTGGICGVVFEIDRKSWSPVFKLMNKHTERNRAYLCAPGMNWDQRAMFALLLAESLEN
jgi:hypothetical protein